MARLYLITALVIAAVLSFVNSQIPTTTIPPTTPLSCPGGGVAWQDIAILYELSYFPDNSSIQFSQQISNAIASTLFKGPAYQFYQANGTRATQITPLPFPGTSEYNIIAEDDLYGKIDSQKNFEDLLRAQLKHSQIGLLKHPTESSVSQALNFLTGYIQQSKRNPPIQNTIVIIAKRDSDVAASQPYISSLKSTGSKIMTIGIGNASLSNLQSLSSGAGYNFLIPDITDTNAVNNVAQQIATQLITDCGITWTPPPTTTPLPTTPYTGPTIATTTTTTSTTIITTTVPTTTNTGTQSTTITPTTVTVTGSTAPPETSITTNPPPTNVSTSLSPSPSPSTTMGTPPTPNSNTTTTPTTTPASTTTTGNQYKDNASNMHSFSYYIIFLSFLYIFANLF